MVVEFLADRLNSDLNISECGENSGIDCFADDRDAFNDFAKYFNNQHLSDVSIKIDEERYAAHKIVLCRSSEVFDRMLSKRWNKQTAHELKLSEESACRQVFSMFLRFLYCNHVVLNKQNVLPLLILADKYSVHGLRKDLTLKCVQKISMEFCQLISDEWQEDWISLDRDQLIELLKSNDLTVPNEFVLWEAVNRWFYAPQHAQRRGQNAGLLVQQVFELIRFPYMTADELAEVETSKIAQEHKTIVSTLTHLAFKYISMTLASRAKSSEFNGVQFILRNYMDTRWDKRLTIPAEQLQLKPSEHRFNITTRSSTFPLQQWDWELVFARNNLTTTAYSISSRNSDELSIELKSVDLDQQRSVEYLLIIVNDKELLRTFSGRKTFTKSRTTETLELENRLTLNDLFERTLLYNGELNLQLILRPIV